MIRLALIFTLCLLTLNFIPISGGDMMIKHSTAELIVDNDQLSGDHIHPFVATLSNGEIAIAYVWSNNSVSELYLSKPYTTPSSIIKVYEFPYFSQITPLIIVQQDAFIVIWFVQGVAYINEGGIYQSKFSNALQKTDSEFKITTILNGNLLNLSPIQSSNGYYFSAALNKDETGYMVVWGVFSGSSGSHYIFGQYFDQAETPIQTTFRINNYTTYTQNNIRVISIGEGLFCVTWNSYDTWDSYDTFNSLTSTSFSKVIDKYGNSNGTIAASTPDTRIFIDATINHFKTDAVYLGDERILFYSWPGNQIPQLLAAHIMYHNGTRIGQQREYIEENVAMYSYEDKKLSSVSFTVANQTFAVIVSSCNFCDGFEFGIEAIITDNNGDMIGTPFLVNTDYTYNQNSPHLSVRNSSRIDSVEIVFAFQSNGMYNNGTRIISSIFTFDLSNYKRYLPSLSSNKLNPTFIYRAENEYNFSGPQGTDIYRPWMTTQTSGKVAMIYDSKNGTTPLSNGAGGYSTDSSLSRVIGSLFSKDAPMNILTTIQANNNTKNDQISSMVISLANDTLGACWASNGEGTGWDVVCGIFNSNWSRIGKEFIANIDIMGDQGNPNLDCKLAYCNNRFGLTPLNEGNAFIVVYSAGTENDLDIYAVIYNVSSTGAQLFKSNFLVNAITEDTQADPRAVELSTGGIIIVWSTNWHDSDKQWDIYGRVFDSSYNPITKDIRINKYARHSQHSGSLIVLENDTVVVMWVDVQRNLLVTQIMDSLLNRIGSENTFPIEALSIEWTVLPRGIHLGANHFAITFAQGNNVDGSGSGCFLAFFDPEGAMIGNIMQANQKSRGDQQNCNIAKFLDENSFIIAWDDYEPPFSRSIRTCQYSFDLAQMSAYFNR